jgi:RNA polymerase sigma-70 factor (ECF subfamily)
MMALQAMEESVPDADLARLAAGGDRASFAALIERHYAFIYRMAWRQSGNRTDAEDIAQDVCARLGATIRTYRGGSAFTTWLYAIIANASRDANRKRERETTKTKAWAVEALAEGALADAEPDDPAGALWDAVRQLPPKQQEAVTLVYGEGMNHAEAADLMAISEPTVSWHIHEAKKRLKQIMSAGDA